MHLLVMAVFALITSIVFAVLNSEKTDIRSRFLYGLKVFISFIGIGLIIAWVMYPFPR